MLKKWFDPGKKELKEARKIADKVFALEAEMAQLTDAELQAKTPWFKERYQQGESLELLMPEAFAVVREASRRVTKLFPYYVQVLGAVAIFHGNIAEMKTGEGKTLTAVMPAYLSALNGEGVHIVTVNEYLAKREVQGDIGDLFRFLGLTVGLNLRDITREEKRAAYDSDILYSTNAELGFDYLRDHMVLYAKDMVQQRGLTYAIIDEVDSILIDEARTPLIISGGEKNNHNLYQSADRFAKSLRDEDFEIDLESKTIALTPSGIKRAEQIFQLENLYDLRHVTLVHHINNALRAVHIMSRDVEYVVQDGEVLIVDQFTGRILRGRQFSEGLHQALEAKEGVQIKKETVTVATITYQNFFRMYKKLSGMTGTAKTEEEEFRDIYNMDVVEVPTNAPVIRLDEPDFIYANQEDKFNALCDEVEMRHQKGQPMLIGTIAVETSELLSRMLKLRRINHEVLNAKNHEREAEIVAKAGLMGSVTIATNMAGRGTDIKLGSGVVALGGLAVIGSERHESRRIDNQLRGRSGRQGDPGYSRFYLSADDELMQRFGGDTFKRRVEMLERLNTTGEPLASKMFSRFVSSAQKRIEGNNYDTRKNVLKYDDVLRKQREIIYKERRDVLTLGSIENQVRDTVRKSLSKTLHQFIHPAGKNQFKIDDDNIIATFNGNIFMPNTLQKETIEKMDEVELEAYILELAEKELNRKKEMVPPEIYNEFLKVVMLRVIDTYWMRHIDAMSELRQAVGLQAYGQQSPLVIYQQQGLAMFNEMVDNISKDVTRYAIRAQIQYNVEREAVVKNTQTNEGRSDQKPKKPKVKKNRGQRNMPWR
ncbi:MAG: preprotein translocase subunit SecA [Tenericutes bacterium GWC2_34_14]|nr:MAG: preprotein translocase subunit SecA [Tenericutes bacterium GWC2_34_14]OHE33869.1 MAG: preprotein translocase subunit SecA [Tenericutes bacterium GWE2_34_108]OHE36604.1 MAG: preprotein translocase subunit SecA [Tenericutes bacterium GWF1_35_14]OHE37820.1 MAG: preprotein translocase subunit SecA [Tenericutes bacterium GWF2_35_184]OHE45275.1 MAG: preprotein translocase subunit SecA [Tenericutes bacterium RIFOXYA2_FULL_36_32]OHE45953.1 MAG: preprotein translocase subunit SecA [Tenericutes 